MKIAFSNKYSERISFSEYLENAKRLGYDGVEIADFSKNAFEDALCPFSPAAAAATKRKIYNSRTAVFAIDSGCDISAAGNALDNIRLVKEAIAAAADVNVPYVRVCALSRENSAFETVKAFLEIVIPAAESENIILLLETAGIFSSTAVLRDLLNYFASDYLAADWNMYETYFAAGESAQDSITNLGAYVKSVHIADAKKYGEPALIGEGELPVDDMMRALGSVNFKGFIVPDWEPETMPQADGGEIILTHFESFISRYLKGGEKKRYYYNKAGTGRFVWKKDELIDKTFSGVLDTCARSSRTHSALNIQRLITPAATHSSEMMLIILPVRLSLWAWMPAAMLQYGQRIFRSGI